MQSNDTRIPHARLIKGRKNFTQKLTQGNLDWTAEARALVVSGLARIFACITAVDCLKHLVCHDFQKKSDKLDYTNLNNFFFKSSGSIFLNFYVREGVHGKVYI